MAYFSNGSEGDYYAGKYCNRCVNGQENREGFNPCSVLSLHELWNYDQHRDTPEGQAKKEALTILWPRDGIHNGQCTMFKVIA